jgi:hypothetical protein
MFKGQHDTPDPIPHRLSIVDYDDCIVRLPSGEIRPRSKPLPPIATVPPPEPQTIGRITTPAYRWYGLLIYDGRTLDPHDPRPFNPALPMKW